jgi:hypothetical protein
LLGSRRLRAHSIANAGLEERAADSEGEETYPSLGTALPAPQAPAQERRPAQRREPCPRVYETEGRTSSPRAPPTCGAGRRTANGPEDLVALDLDPNTKTLLFENEKDLRVA